MKILLQQTIQAIVNANNAAAVEPSHRNKASPRLDDSTVTTRRTLMTKLGSITLRMPVTGGVPFLPQLLARYSAGELNFLLLLGRMSVRGRASAGIVREMVERLCGHRLEAERLAEIGAAVEHELANCLQRELECARSMA